MGSSDPKTNQQAVHKINTVKREEDMTHGVDIESWKDQNEQTLFSIWDFAGKKKNNQFFFFLI